MSLASWGAVPGMWEHSFPDHWSIWGPHGTQNQPPKMHWFLEGQYFSLGLRKDPPYPVLFCSVPKASWD